MKLLKLWLLISSLLTTSTLVADELLSLKVSEPNPFPKSSLYLGLMQNSPMKPSEKYFQKNQVSLELGYKYNLNIEWMLSVSLGSKSFSQTEEDSNINLNYACTSTEYLSRISYPIYLGIGYRLYYFVATKGKSFPLGADSSFSPEVGLGLNANLYYILSEKILSGLSIESWRGVGTSKLNGFETKLSIAFAI